jgi:hypothetical protein
MRRPTIFMSTLAAVLLAQSAFAGPSDIEARREAYRKGYAALEAKNWDTAYQIFKQLWLDQPAYDVALNLGQAELRLHKYRDAAEHLTYATTHFPAAEDRQILDRALRGLEQAKRESGRLIVVVDRTGADVRVDGKSIGSTPIDGERFVDPGEHAVEASLSGFTNATQSFQVTAGQSQTIVLKLDPAPALSGAPTAPPAADAGELTAGASPNSLHTPNYTAPIVAASVGGAALIGAITTLVISVNKQADADERAKKLTGSGGNECAPGIDAERASECTKIVDLAKSATALRNVAFVGFGVTAVAGVATWLLWPHSQPKAIGARIMPSVSISQKGAFASVTGAF